MVPLRCKTLHQIPVSREALKAAERTDSIWEYTKSLLMDFFDPQIAVLCIVGGTNDEAWDDENMRATLPAEPLGVFLGTLPLLINFLCLYSNTSCTADHISIVAKEYYKTGIDEDDGDFRWRMRSAIQRHLESLRQQRLHYDGPTDDQLKKYREAGVTRFSRKRKI